MPEDHTDLPIHVRQTERMCRGNGIALTPPEITGHAPTPSASPVEMPIHRTGERIAANIDPNKNGGA